ncbi:hypothetical protein GCM10010259_43740 [Streptomyces daghestanicus]|uniref:Uncharacterized protein n=1 Tax=Streptomyces daghestanicus TaxID=66885 RepID=A0ABQ3PZ71_9ACTN|nr:hypothetical protein GCM10010259_43740 [Streptomyces daghestanicus]GHI30325.1 hypothetical protein Sdagh_20550 [Streptomyces daghestanicus]
MPASPASPARRRRRPGVGGHRIPVAPHCLSYKVRSLGIPFRFVELAQEIDQRMPAHVGDRAAKLFDDVGRRCAAHGSCCSASPASPASPTSGKPRAGRGRPLPGPGAELVYGDRRVERWTVAGAPVERAGGRPPPRPRT